MAALLPLLGLISVLCTLQWPGFVSGNVRPPRETDAPPPIDCLLSSWGKWTECDPCTKQRYRSRSIEKFGQFGGKPCLSNLGEYQRCVSDKLCQEKVIDCGNDFQCENGRCIKQRLKCNVDNDCGDFTDEECEDRDPKPVCRDDIELSELARTAGNGINILGMDIVANPFDNEHFNGICNRVRDGTTRTYYRLPWNIATLNYRTVANKAFTSETYSDSVTVVEKVLQESTDNFEASLSFKLTPTEQNNGGESAGNAVAGGEGVDKVAAGGEGADKVAAGGEGADKVAAGGEGADKVAAGGEGADKVAAGGEGADKVAASGDGGKQISIGGKIGINKTKKESVKDLKEYKLSKNKKFMRVLGSVQLATFQTRTRGYVPSQTFLDDVDKLPSFYDKAEYFSFVEMYGTHYAASGSIGGIYHLIYVLDSTVLTNNAISDKEVEECLGYNLGLNVDGPGLEGKFEVKNPKCKKHFEHKEGAPGKSGVIDKVISFVEGGTPAFAAKFNAKLEHNEKIDIEVFVEWAASLSDNPVVIKSKKSPIYLLIPPELKEAYNKSQNLQKAIQDYYEEYSTCKCQPCRNGGTVLLVDGECLCKCPDYFEGVACQTPKSALYQSSPSNDGHWSCWSDSSSCIKEEKTQTRQCNNPAPQNGGKPCAGENVRQVLC